MMYKGKRITSDNRTEPEQPTPSEMMATAQSLREQISKWASHPNFDRRMTEAYKAMRRVEEILDGLRFTVEIPDCEYCHGTHPATILCSEAKR